MDTDEPVIVGYRLTGRYDGPIKVDDFYPLNTWENLERNRRNVPVVMDKGNESPKSAQGIKEEPDVIQDDDHEENTTQLGQNARWNAYLAMEAIVDK